MYNDAERLSVMLKRVRSLGLSLGSARQAQERASTLENFEEAKAFRDEAREADVWLRQTLRDASVGVQLGCGLKGNKCLVSPFDLPHIDPFFSCVVQFDLV